MDTLVNRRAVLILSSDPLPAALLGAAVELAGHVPRFAHEGEAPRAALLRLRPDVVLVDCGHEVACADSFIGPAIMTGARVVMVRAPRSSRDIEALAAHRQLTLLELPLEDGELAKVLE